MAENEEPEKETITQVNDIEQSIQKLNELNKVSEVLGETQKNAPNLTHSTDGKIAALKDVENALADGNKENVEFASSRADVHLVNGNDLSSVEKTVSDSVNDGVKVETAKLKDGVTIDNLKDMVHDFNKSSISKPVNAALMNTLGIDGHVVEAGLVLASEANEFVGNSTNEGDSKTDVKSGTMKKKGLISILRAASNFAQGEENAPQTQSNAINNAILNKLTSGRN